MSHTRRLLVSLLFLSLAGCATVAQVTNLSAMTCRNSLHSGLSEILAEQGESTDAAIGLAEDVLAQLAHDARGPRPFLVAAPSGTDYVFFVDKKTDGCLLRLYGRRHGFVSYTNNLTWIATRPLRSCECTP